MKIKRALFINIVIAILVACAVLFLANNGFLERLELMSKDLSFRLKGATPGNSKIVIVEITDNDILGTETWPWRRTWYADITRALTELGVKYVYFDMIFSEPSVREDDIIFEEELKISKNTYLPFTFLGHSFDFGSVLMPIKRFMPYLKGTGAINTYPDIDGIIRRIPLIFLTDSGLQPHIALKIAMDYTNADIQDIGSESMIFSLPQGEFELPLTGESTMLINWAGRWQDTFKHYTFLQVLAGYRDILKNREPRIKLEDFKDSICLISLTATGLSEVKSVPLQLRCPNVAIIANVISNILDQNFLYLSPKWLNILMLYLLTLLPAFLISGEKPFREIMAIILIGAVYFIVSLFAFYQNIILNYSAQLLSLFVGAFTMGSYSFVCVAIERKSLFKESITDGLTGLYNIRYFRTILETEIALVRGSSDSSSRFSIIMIDIDHFKNFNDTYGHQSGDLVLKEVANTLKESLRSADIVARYGGEEMIILLRATQLQGALAVSEKIRKNTEMCLVKDKDNAYKVTISLGVATFSSTDNIETIIKRADNSLYRAKELGRNRVFSVET